MNEDWRKLPSLRNDALIFEDTSGMPMPNTIVPCLLCTKPFLVRPYSGEPDQVCPACWDTYKDAARVVCAGCKIKFGHSATICRLVPKMLDNGFYIRPRMVLHSTACNVCQEGLKRSTIIEIDAWMKYMRPGKIIVPFGKSR